MGEFALLCLPIIKENLTNLNINKERDVNRPVYAAFFTLFVVLTFMFIICSFYPLSGKYPFIMRDLPHGNAVFLKKTSVSGNVYNYANTGGYLRWMLYPEYKIFADMEVPFLFSDIDILTSNYAFDQKEVLRKFLNQYDPDFISAPSSLKRFKDMIKEYPRYSAVFFDNVEVLFVNKNKHPEIADEYELKEIDPFEIIGMTLNDIAENKLDAYLAELLKVYTIYDGCEITNQVIAMIYNLKKDYEKALFYSDKLINDAKELYGGYMLKADALIGLEKYDEAIVYLNKAIERAQEESDKKDIYKKLWFCYLKKGDDKKAYKTLKRAVEMIQTSTSYSELYSLGLLAVKNREFDEALFLFQLAYLKVPPSDRSMYDKILNQIEVFTKAD
ncbi:TPR-repeat-containing protein [Candidatus Magnetoovum chiemensis]|nr:TPR-repeat-containing protein [Candidatus Magnetoovum chiemensis]